jgi:hypothetical protein
LATRERPRVLLAAFLQHRERLEGGREGSVHVSARRDCGPDVLLDGEAAEHPAVLGDPAQAPLGDGAGPFADQLLAVEPDATLPGWRELEHRPHRGGFADAVAP